MVRGSPSMCIRQQPARAPATSPASSGSKRKAETSLTIVAPASSAARATATFVVSIETRGPAPDSCSTTGNTRRSSSSAGTGSAPGRVDSPPTSRMSAPSAASWRPCATAASGSRNRPPSENESGVTFTTPISCSESTPGVCPQSGWRRHHGRNGVGARVDGQFRRHLPRHPDGPHERRDLHDPRRLQALALEPGRGECLARPAIPAEAHGHPVPHRPDVALPRVDLDAAATRTPDETSDHEHVLLADRIDPLRSDDYVVVDVTNAAEVPPPPLTPGSTA